MREHLSRWLVFLGLVCLLAAPAAWWVLHRVALQVGDQADSPGMYAVANVSAGVLAVLGVSLLLAAVIAPALSRSRS